MKNKVCDDDRLSGISAAPIPRLRDDQSLDVEELCRRERKQQ